MTKAFDSVGFTPLRKAMERLKIPEHTISYIIDLFDKKVIRVITAQGLSEPFIGEDGIDQGETISPLLWRIFYDPLLCRIQNDNDLGYETSLKRNNDNSHHDDSVTAVLKTAASAYADDTIWLAKNK